MQIHTCIDKIKKIGPSQKFVLSIKCYKEYYDIRALWIFHTIFYLQLSLNPTKIRSLVITYCKFYILSTWVSIINDFAYFTYLLHTYVVLQQWKCLKCFILYKLSKHFYIFFHLNYLYIVPHGGIWLFPGTTDTFTFDVLFLYFFNDIIFLKLMKHDNDNFTKSFLNNFYLV